MMSKRAKHAQQNRQQPQQTQQPQRVWHYGLNKYFPIADGGKIKLFGNGYLGLRYCGGNQVSFSGMCLAQQAYSTSSNEHNIQGIVHGVMYVPQNVNLELHITMNKLEQNAPYPILDGFIVHKGIFNLTNTLSNIRVNNDVAVAVNPQNCTPNIVNYTKSGNWYNPQNYVSSGKGLTVDVVGGSLDIQPFA